MVNTLSSRNAYTHHLLGRNPSIFEIEWFFIYDQIIMNNIKYIESISLENLIIDWELNRGLPLVASGLSTHKLKLPPRHRIWFWAESEWIWWDAGPTSSYWSTPEERHRRSTTRPSGWATRKRLFPRDIPWSKATDLVAQVGQMPFDIGPVKAPTPVPRVWPSYACRHVVSVISPTFLSVGISGCPLNAYNIKQYKYNENTYL